MSTIEQKASLSGTATPKARLNASINSNISLSGNASGSNRTGTSNYEQLSNLPSIEAVQLIGDKSFEDLGLEECSNIEIDNIFRSIF